MSQPYLNASAPSDDDAALSANVKIFFSVILSLIMTLSCVGNVVTCAVIVKEKSMRTPTNAYLFNLAIADLLLTIFIPVDIYLLMWFPYSYPLGDIGCRVQYMFACFCNVSVLTITVFTVERYLVISRPFLRQSLADITRVYKIVFVIWVVSVALCVPESMSAAITRETRYRICSPAMSSYVKVFIVFEVLSLFVVPMVVISSLYARMWLRLRRAGMRRSAVTPVRVGMLAAVAGFFFFCWSPFAVMRVYSVFPNFESRIFRIHNSHLKILYNIVIVNSYLSTAVNPVLYGLNSKKFRRAFRDLINWRCQHSVVDNGLKKHSCK